MTFFAGLAGKIIWDWLKSRKTEIPKAEDGFLSLAILKQHCKEQQANCTKSLMGELKLIIIRLENRLENGDKLFKDVQKTLKVHSRVLVVMSRQLKALDEKYSNTKTGEKYVA